MGARPIKRAIQTYVENTLAKEILSGDIKEGDKLTATVENDAIVYKKG
jgi:ATP-dependent Clp protease ATP-binding subunit ClpB